jgi:hypothetical protein
MREKIIFEGCEHDVEVKPVTLVFNKTWKESVYPERVMITPEMSLSHFYSMKDVNNYVICFFKLVVSDYPHSVTKDNISESALGFRHLIGLFDLSLQFLAQKKNFGWKYPETGLHPKYQLELAEALIIFSQVDLFVNFIDFVRKGYFDEYILDLNGLDSTLTNIRTKFYSLCKK